jgi:hypothetical protein
MGETPGHLFILEKGLITILVATGKGGSGEATTIEMAF